MGWFDPFFGWWDIVTGYAQGEDLSNPEWWESYWGDPFSSTLWEDAYENNFMGIKSVADTFEDFKGWLEMYWWMILLVAILFLVLIIVILFMVLRR